MQLNSFVFDTPTGHTGHMLRNQQPDLAVGQRFRASNGIEWEVVKSLQMDGEHPHVALVKVQDRLDRKVISVDALFDKRLFSLVE